MPVLQTTRLLLRELTSNDAEDAYLLNLDPEVIKYTGDKPFESIDHSRLFLQNYDHYQRYGFGRWAVMRKSDDEFLGWCGLKYTQEINEYDIGFRFFKKHWNQGFATESAKACLEFGFNEFKIEEIVGRARKENVASIRVLEKIGMRYCKAIDFDGKEGVIYKIESTFL